MPLFVNKPLPVILQDVNDLLRRLRETRREGFFFNQKMMGDLLATKYGMVLGPELAAAVFKQVTDRFCPYELPIHDWTADQAIAAAEQLAPSGIVAVQLNPFLLVRFSDVTDIVKYRLLLPETALALR